MTTHSGHRSPGHRSVELPDGRALVVRPVRPDDVDGLRALYDDLDDDDRYRRFFSAYHPDRAFFVKLATEQQRGGYGLVAEVLDTGDERRIVGECGYTLPQGGGAPELAITVARHWRGWLGAYLLDALLEVAASRGIPNLRAEILLANRPMLALARARGYATVAHSDWTVVSVLIGTAGRTPSWPERDARARVLVEVPGGRWHAEAQAREAGLDVLVCPGPGSYPARCPVLEGRPCPLADGADAIVVVPRPDDPRWSALLDAHAELHAGLPVVIQQGAGEPIVTAVVQRLARGGDDQDAVARSET